MRCTPVFFGVAMGLFTLLSVVPEAVSLPRMSAASGAPCTTCHYNADGGGLRSEIGWGTQWMTGAIDHDTTGLSFLDDRSTNKVLDWMAVGGDARLQVTRIGEPSLGTDEQGEPVIDAPSRAVFPMQFQPYVAVMPHDALTVHGSLDIVPLAYDDGSDGICSTPYPGQTCAQAHATIDPWDTGPSIRAGRFRPSIGMRHDDHTLLTHSDASRRRPVVIPPNYAEAGVEASYQPRHWLRVDAGVFRTDQLTDAVGDPLISDAWGSAAYLARASYFPRFDFGPDRSFYGWIGGSVYGDGAQRFRADQGFIGLGWLDQGSLMFELAHLTFGPDPDRRAFNASGIANYQVREWLIAEARLERAATRDYAGDESHRNYAAVAGVQFYPVPFVKLRPEFRFSRSDDWHMGQYTVQLHLFY